MAWKGNKMNKLLVIIATVALLFLALASSPVAGGEESSPTKIGEIWKGSYQTSNPYGGWGTLTILETGEIKIAGIPIVDVQFLTDRVGGIFHLCLQITHDYSVDKEYKPPRSGSRKVIFGVFTFR